VKKSRSIHTVKDFLLHPAAYMDSHIYCTQNNVYLLIIKFKNRYLFPIFILYFFCKTNKLPLLHTTFYLNNTTTVNKHPSVYAQSVPSCLAMKVLQNTYYGFSFQPSLHLCEDQLQQQGVPWKRPEAVEFTLITEHQDSVNLKKRFRGYGVTWRKP
jgi:hypothetical protein